MPGSHWTDVLGLSKDATLQEIRTAYKRSALAHHPDKPGGSAASFALVHRAYQDALNNHHGGDLGTDTSTVTAIAQFMRWFAAAAKAAMMLKEQIRAPDIVIDLPVTLEDVFFRRVKKVVLSVRRWSAEAASFVRQRQVVMVPVTEARDRDVSFEACGDDPDVAWFMLMKSSMNTNNNSRTRGDVRVRVRYQPHDVYRVDDTVSPLDLHAEVSVSPIHYYYGMSVDLPHFEGPAIRAEYHGRTGRKVHVEHGRGLFATAPSTVTRGDVYVFFELAMPDIPTERLDDPSFYSALEYVFCSPSLTTPSPSLSFTADAPSSNK